MWPDRVSNPGPLTYESGAISIALRGPASTAVQPTLLVKECPNNSIRKHKLPMPYCLWVQTFKPFFPPVVVVVVMFPFS